MKWPAPEEFLGHPAEDRSERFPRDQFLRGRGYKLKDRPAGKPAIWLGPDGKPHEEDIALALENYRG